MATSKVPFRTRDGRTVALPQALADHLHGVKRVGSKPPPAAPKRS